ncbi:MAG: hypothetical protein SFZ23_12465 [Planctomycetota bacterium]|nr:hypothetical protein [Planctomycetota bacterium]
MSHRSSTTRGTSTTLRSLLQGRSPQHLRRGAGSERNRSAAGPAAGLFEPLESRSLLSAPAIVSASALEPVAVVGQTVTLETIATDPDGIRVATWFLDLDGNRWWTRGVDRDLGATWAPTPNPTSATLRKTVPVDASWPAQAVIMTDVVDALGNTSGRPRAIEITRVNPSLPTILAAGAQQNLAVIGETVTLETTAADADGVRLATWFIDIDGNRWWTRGVDRDLGATFASTPNPQVTTLRKTVTVDSSWPAQAVIMTDVVDSRGTTSGRPRAIELPRAAPPIEGTMTFSRSVIAPGEAVDLTVQLTGLGSVGSVSFFVDMNENRRWDAGIDQPFGVATSPVSGSPGTWRLSTTAEWNWGSNVADLSQMAKYWRVVGARVTMSDGSVSPLAVTNTLTIAPYSTLTELRVVGASGSSVTLSASVNTLSASGWIQIAPGGPNTPTGVTFFHDANASGAYEAGVDSILGTVTSPTSGSATYQLSASGSWAYPRQFGAFVTDNRPGGGAWPVRLTEQASATIAKPTVSNPRALSVPKTFRLSPLWIEGEDVRLEVQSTARSGSQLASVTAFYDRNANGRFDSGTDQVIQERAISGTSTTSEFRFAVAGEGMVSIGVFARDTGGGANATGDARTFNVLVTRPVQASNVTLTPSNSLPRTLEVAMDASTRSGVRSVAAFIDLNNDGVYNGLDRIVSSVAASSGSSINGRWRLAADVSGLANGSYSVVITAQNFWGVESRLTQSVVIGAL